MLELSKKYEHHRKVMDHTMVNMRNNRHITDVVLFVHNAPKLISRKLHLHQR